MHRDRLVSLLDAYFRVADVRGDDWTSILDVVYEVAHWKAHAEPAWRSSFNGLMIRGADEVTSVATCVFPSDAILGRLAPGTFVFTEHPVDDAPGDVFAPWSKATFERMRADGISVYTVHAPLDHHPEVSPSGLLASALGLRDATRFHRMAEGLPGGAAVYGESEHTVAELQARVQEALGAEVPVALALGLTLDEARARPAGRVAIVAGGGASIEVLEEALAHGCTTYVTGNAMSPCRIPFVRAIHDAFRARAREAGIAVIDGTHYGTEKPAQIAMLDWFRAQGLTAEFAAGVPER